MIPYDSSLNLRYARDIGGEDYINDMAQAWIEGRHEEVLSYVAERERAVRARAVPVKIHATRGRPVEVDRARVRDLHELGLTTRQIATAMNCGAMTVSRICRKAA